MLISIYKIDGFAQIFYTSWKLIYFLQNKYDTKTHLWNIFVAKYFNWIKINKHVECMHCNELLIISNDICAIVIHYFVDLCREIFYIASIHANFCVKTFKNRLLMHLNDDLNQYVLCYCLFFNHRISMQINSQNMTIMNSELLC